MLSCACLPCTQELEAGGCLSYIVRSRPGLYEMVSKQDEQEATESLECLPKLWSVISDQNSLSFVCGKSPLQSRMWSSVGRTMVNIWAACLRCAAGTCELGFQIFPLGLLLSLCSLGRDPNSRQSPESFLLTGILQLAV